ncbi:glycosyltransferase family 2 protein [Methylophaga sp.]|uniref:glycosyltransferase family 2 protein n=1 Tax=Methylophaga sp. TaxID=2024840 RepID=UPI003A8E90DF
MPKISVVMAVYNGGSYLKLAIDSILNQTFTDFEFIIINDGSTDTTLDVLTEYSSHDERIRVVSRGNKGLVASLNEGISIARAPFIARMDADDIAFPSRLEKQLTFISENSNIVCVGSYYEVIDDEGLKLTISKGPIKNDSIQSALMKGHTVICHPTAMFRTDAVRSVGGYDEKFFLVEDLDLWLKLGEVGDLSNIPEPLLSYRTNSNSVSTQNGKFQLAKAESVIEEASVRRGVDNQFELKKHWRPDETKNSQLEFALKYGWWAFNYKNKSAAIKYAKKAIKIMPLNIAGWKLLVLSYLKLKETYV